jgi:hypothetical protein
MVLIWREGSELQATGFRLQARAVIFSHATFINSLHPLSADFTESTEFSLVNNPTIDSNHIFFDRKPAA